MIKIEFTDEYKQLLLQIPLFKDLESELKKRLINDLVFTLYEVSRKEVVVQQDTRCNYLYVLLKGELTVDIIEVTGNLVRVEEILAPRAFATPHLFGENTILPATFTASTDSVLLMATRASVFKLISSAPQLLQSFLCVTGRCNKCTVTRLRILSYKNIRSRFVFYLMEHRTSPTTALLEHNQVQLSDYLGVTRPALSKEINKIVREGYIAVNRKEVMLLNIQALKEFV